MNDKLVLIGLSFGMSKDKINHCISNYYIAKALSAEMYTEQCAAIVQWEIYEIIQKQFPERVQGLQLYPIYPEPGKYLDTYDVLKKAAQIVEDEHFSSITYFGHQAHLWRIRQVGFKLGIPEDEKNITKIPYDENSKQWWTRNAFLFWLREVPVIIVWTLMFRM